eukprot:gene19589-26272_t
MARPRMTTVKDKLVAIAQHLENNKVGRAKAVVDALLKKMEDSKSANPRPLTDYQKFVKMNFARIAEENPGKKAPMIMQMLAREYAT